MSDTPMTAAGAAETAAERMPTETRWDGAKRFIRTQPLGAISGLVILVFIVLAFGASMIAPYDPLAQDRVAILQAPSGAHLLGTDDLGRDVLSRIMHGSQISLYVGTMTILVSLLIGATLGIASGYLGGPVDAVLQGFIDAMLSIPPLILALFIASLLGPSVSNVIIALVVLTVPRFARIARGEMLRIKSEDFISAAVVLGAGRTRVMMRHGLPNMVPSLIVVASLGFGTVIVAEAALTFLGIGTPPPNPSWGLMLSQGATYFQVAPWMIVFPGLAISATVLAFNLLGDSLRDFFDPKLVR